MSGDRMHAPVDKASLPVKNRGLQARVDTGADRLEQEADRVATQAVGSGHATAPMPLQRAGGGSGLGEGSHEVRQVLGASGSGLDAGTRAHFEARFGHDFSRVGVHADAPAARASQALGAQAFTFGHHVGFAAGEFAPSTSGGRSLIAHELVHVLQQTLPGGQARMALKKPEPEPAPDATPVEVTATPVRGENGAQRIAAAIKLLKKLRDQVTAAPGQAASQQRYVLTMIEMLSQQVVGSRMTPAFAPNEDARGDARRCEEALGALRFLETGFRVAIPDLGKARTWDAAIGALQRAQTPLAQLLNYMSPRERFKAMARDAQAHGMPVNMLDSVAQDSDLARASPSEDERYEPRANRLFLKERTLKKGMPATARDSLSASAMGTLYHESTHAFLSRHRDTEPYKSAIDAAIGHYTDAPMGRDREPTKDPYRVVQEAAGGYVDARVNAWWSAYSNLSHHASRGTLNEDIVAGIRKEYDEAQTDFTWGYDETVMGEQRYTKRPMSEPLIKLINRDILEGKIAQPFDEVPQFKTLIDGARAHKQMGTP